MPERTFHLHHALGDVVVESASAVVEAQLRGRLEPYVRLAEGAAPGAAPDLVVLARPEAAPLPPGSSSVIMIRDHPVIEKYRRPADLWERAGEYVLHERKNGSVFRWRAAAPARVVVANADEESLAKSARRLIQDFLRLRVWDRGGVIVEASTTFVDGVGMLTVGGSGTGKTTLLARLLEIGGEMVSNDEVALCLEGDDVVAYGLPMLINVRPPLVDRFPRLREHAHRLDGGDAKAAVRYDAFARALGASVRASTDRLVGVLLTAGREPARPLDADGFASALMDNLLSGPGFAGLGWSSPWRRLPPGFREPPRREVERRARSIARRVPAITVGRLHAPDAIARVAADRRASAIA